MEASFGPCSLFVEVAMKVMSNGKVRRSEGEWREVFARQEESGLSVREFCRKEEIGFESFRRWREKLAESGSGSVFVPVSTESPLRSSWTLEITLPGGGHLRLQG
ncbi:MAG: hypothetical protein ABIK65_13365 [Candidatus Eisenbacteria bacterium]